MSCNTKCSNTYSDKHKKTTTKTPHTSHRKVQSCLSTITCIPETFSKFEPSTPQVTKVTLSPSTGFPVELIKTKCIAIHIPINVPDYGSLIRNPDATTRHLKPQVPSNSHHTISAWATPRLSPTATTIIPETTIMLWSARNPHEILVQIRLKKFHPDPTHRNTNQH